MNFDRFASPWAFWLLAIPATLAIVAIIRGRRSAPRPSLVYSAQHRAASLAPSLRARFVGAPLLLRILALTLLILALARPQDEMGRTKTSTEGIALQLVIDRSGSMEEPMRFGGTAMSRLDVVKRVASEFLVGNDAELAGRAGDLVGMIAFASYADTVAPLTQSPELVAELLQDVQIARLRSESGTAIGDALALALARLKRAEEEIGSSRADPSPTDADAPESDTFSIKGKAVVLLTDGENNQGDIDPMQSAALAERWGIRVYTIGIGEGRFIELGGRRIPTGGVDGRTLQAIADRTGGKFWLASDAEALREVYAEIDRLETTLIETEELTDYEEAFTPFALAGLVALALEIFVRTAVLRRAP
jgi:Ca-activated chloride channel family protein